MSKNCKGCKKKLSDEIAIACDACNSWQCYLCLNIPKYLFDAITKFTKEDGDLAHIFISCKKCMVSVMPVAAIKKGVSIDTKVLSDKIDALNLNVEGNIMDQIEKIEKKLDEEFKSQVLILKEQLEMNNTKVQSLSDESTLRWADVVKRSDKSDAAINKVEVAITKSAKDHTVFEEREKSIIVYNREESRKVSKVDRDSEDIEFVKDFINNGLHLSPQAIQSCFRLGHFNKDVCRPIRITFCSKASQILVMNNVSSLKDSEACFNKLSVSVDRSLDQRALFKAKVEEAKKLSTETGKIYRVRGTYTPIMYEKL